MSEPSLNLAGQLEDIEALRAFVDEAAPGLLGDKVRARLSDLEAAVRENERELDRLAEMLMEARSEESVPHGGDFAWQR